MHYIKACRAPYFYDSGSCYYLGTYQIDYVSAEKACQRDGANLVIFNSNDEYERIVKFFENSGFSGLWVIIHSR